MKRYFQKLVEIILKGTSRVLIMNFNYEFLFSKMLSVFKIFVNKVIQKLLRIWYYVYIPVELSLTGVCGNDFRGSKNEVTALDTGGNCCTTSVCNDCPTA